MLVERSRGLIKSAKFSFSVLKLFLERIDAALETLPPGKDGEGGGCDGVGGVCAIFIVASHGLVGADTDRRNGDRRGYVPGCEGSDPLTAVPLLRCADPATKCAFSFTP